PYRGARTPQSAGRDKSIGRLARPVAAAVGRPAIRVPAVAAAISVVTDPAARYAVRCPELPVRHEERAAARDELPSSRVLTEGERTSAAGRRLLRCFARREPSLG